LRAYCVTGLSYSAVVSCSIFFQRSNLRQEQHPADVRITWIDVVAVPAVIVDCDNWRVLGCSREKSIPPPVCAMLRLQRNGDVALSLFRTSLRAAADALADGRKLPRA
jgi:hypothetical protein